ncbi:MAG TPA: tripartite tricarboxylate transporter substrate binding protein [Burkholderiales bacterium]|nr:tripartite tricarboxylate transporter substrate binding protein [Burkholderiales bacterium]
MGSRVLKTLALAAFAISAAHAEVYPAKPIRMIVAYPPGGGTDIVGRMVAQKLGETLGQSVVVENRGGASGNIGTEIAARAAPDGYTVLMGNVAPNAINVSLFKNLPFDPVADFAPVSLVASTPNILVVHPSTPARSVKEVVALARSRPGVLNFASAGVGSSSHLAGELFRILAGADIVHVPYKGAGPAMVDVLSGQVQLYFATMPAAMPHVKSGKLVPIAVTSLKRSQALPDAPTIAESGVPGYEASTWYGLLAPAHSPDAAIARLHESVVKILGDAALRAKLADQGFEPVGDSPKEFAAYIRSEIAKWGKVIRDAGIRPE